MKLTYLKRCLLFRSAFKKQIERLTEGETFILLCIYLMNKKGERCSCNTLRMFMASVNHAQRNKNLRAVIRKFKSDGLIRSFGKVVGANIVVSVLGQLHLIGLEKSLRSMKK
mgnify:CR=1 FL=1